MDSSTCKCSVVFRAYYDEKPFDYKIIGDKYVKTSSIYIDTDGKNCNETETFAYLMKYLNGKEAKDMINLTKKALINQYGN